MDIEKLDEAFNSTARSTGRNAKKHSNTVVSEVLSKINEARNGNKVHIGLYVHPRVKARLEEMVKEAPKRTSMSEIGGDLLDALLFEVK